MSTVTLCAIMRDEGPYVLEWVAHYRALGVDRIVIYDNESTDALPAVCRALQDAGEIDYVPWPNPPPESTVTVQLQAYQHAAASASTEWLCCLDADEFLVMETASTIQDFLATAGRHGMPIALNWRLFGSSGRLTYSPEPVTERFTRCGTADQPASALIKTLGPVSVLRAGAHVHVHGWPLVPGQFYVDALGEPLEVDRHSFVSPPRWRGAWINHYLVKSREEFEHKRKRGSVAALTGTEARTGKGHLTYETYFRPYDVNEEENLTIARFRAATQGELARLAALVEVAGVAAR